MDFELEKKITYKDLDYNGISSAIKSFMQIHLRRPDVLVLTEEMKNNFLKNLYRGNMDETRSNWLRIELGEEINAVYLDVIISNVLKEGEYRLY